jgi:hypothetical protein
MTSAALDPRHDRMHLPDPARERWRESFYFKFFDARLGIGGDTSIGYRPSSGHSGSLNVIWGADVPTLVATELDRYDAHDAPHPVAGMTYEPHEPFGAWSIRFDGRMNDGGLDAAVDPGAVRAVADSDRPSVAVRYELTFTPDQPAYVYREDPRWDGLFDGHVDEVGRVTGTLMVGERSYEIDARGCKDHSWGARDWARPLGWRWIDMLFEDGPEASLWRATFDGRTWLQDGAVYAGGRADPVLAFGESVAFVPRPRAERPASWSFAIRSAAHELRGHAELLRVLPLNFAMRDEHGVRMTAWIDRALYRCDLEDGRRGYGAVELQFRAPLDGDAPHPLTAAPPEPPIRRE